MYAHGHAYVCSCMSVRIPEVINNAASIKDTGHAVFLPAPLLLLLGDRHVQNVHSFLVQHALLQEELHQGKDLCKTQTSIRCRGVTGESDSNSLVCPTTPSSMASTSTRHKPVYSPWVS